MSEFMGSPEAPKSAEVLRNEIDQLDDQMYELVDSTPRSPERDLQVASLQDKIFTARVEILKISPQEAATELAAHLKLHKDDVAEMVMMGMDPSDVAFNIWDGFCDFRLDIDPVSMDTIKSFVAEMAEEEEEEEEQEQEQ